MDINSPVQDSPSEWIKDVNDTLTGLEADVEDIQANQKQFRFIMMGLGAVVALEGLLVMQIMKAVRDISMNLGQIANMVMNPPPMDPNEVRRAQVILGEQLPNEEPVIMTNTETPADVAEAVEVKGREPSDKVKKQVASEDNSEILKLENLPDFPTA